MIQWLRRRFLAGFFVTVPLVISVAAFVWIFRAIDGTLGPWYAEWLGRDVPGLGILTTALLVLVVGAIAGRDYAVLNQVLPFLVVGLVVAAFNAPGLNALSLGEDVAKSLGVRVGMTRSCRHDEEVSPGVRFGHSLCIPAGDVSVSEIVAPMQTALRSASRPACSRRRRGAARRCT